MVVGRNGDRKMESVAAEWVDFRADGERVFEREGAKYAR